MAGKSKARRNQCKLVGPTSDSQAKKTKSMDEALGILAMEVVSSNNSSTDSNKSDDDEDEILS